jgi:LCP family protein required for cell wall assembly
VTRPPEGEGPGGERPFEGLPPEELEKSERQPGDLPDLEPEFIDALRDADDGDGQGEGPPQPQAQGKEPTTQPETDERPETDEQRGTDEEPGAEEQRVAEPPTDATVEFTAAEAAAARGAQQDGEAGVSEDGAAEDEEPRRTIVIGAGPPAPPASPATVPPGSGPRPPGSTPVSPPSAPVVPGAPQKPPPEGDFEPPPKRKRLWLRFLGASFLIIASMAAASAASPLIFLNHVARDLGDLKGVKKQLLPPETGEPENILILGSDRRASIKGSKGLSDTTILLRLDPNNNAIALMSIPRDLKTYVPGVGTTKFNTAYAYGGPKLTLRIVKRITGLEINHVVNVDFLGFQRAVNAIGCVYVEVDRRYYHSNVGLPPSLQYSEINIEPGYQKLCGKDALAYVRYRHTDTDLVRSARQQDFLREARQQVPAQDLFINKRKQLLDIFTTYTTSDISSGETLLQVLKLFVASRNAPIKEIHFPAILHPSYVTASKSAVHAAVDRFLGIEASGGPRGTLNLPTNSGKTGIVPEERKRARANNAQQPKKPRTPSKFNDGLIDASQGSRDVAAEAAAKSLRSFPIFYPRRLPSGSIYVLQPRVYHVRDTDKVSHGAYAEVLQLPQGDYFDVQGLHGWSDPPILSDPSESVTMNGRDYDIFLDGDRIRLISWHEGDNSYWISNSLLQTLTNDQMLGMARSAGKLRGERQKHKHKREQGKRK